MATTSGGPSSDLKERLLTEASKFSFFQIIRLLKLLARNKGERPKIQISPDLSFSFPPTDVVAVREDEEGRFHVTATFLGLYGTSSPLPNFYTEELFEEERQEEGTQREFLNLLNQRIYDLFVKVISRYRLFFQIVEEESEEHLQILFCLLGLGEPLYRKGLPEVRLLCRYLGLLTQYPRSQVGLEILLKDLLGGLPLRIEPCLFRKVSIPEDQRALLGLRNITLGQDLYLGTEVIDGQGKFVIHIGPLAPEDFERICPGSPLFRRLTWLVDFYLSVSLEYEIEVELKRGQAKPASLGGEGWQILGINTWLVCSPSEGPSKVKFSGKGVNP